MAYLFWAQVVCWAGLFIYVYVLIRKNQNLRREIEALKRDYSEVEEEKVS